jgi:hypothetical protein
VWLSVSTTDFTQGLPLTMLDQQIGMTFPDEGHPDLLSIVSAVPYVKHYQRFMFTVSWWYGANIKLQQTTANLQPEGKVGDCREETHH